MDLRRTVESMYPGKNVAPDFSSYQAMIASWRIGLPPPPMDEIEVEWAKIQKADAEVAYIEERQKQIEKDGALLTDMVKALWDKANADEALFDKLNPIIQKANNDFPAPVK